MKRRAAAGGSSCWSVSDRLKATELARQWPSHLQPATESLAVH